MSDMSAPATAGRTPWHFWIVAILGLLWNAFGAYDYIMTQTADAGYLAMMTPEQADYFTNMPLWLDVVWAVGVWSAVLAAILFVLKRGWAVWLYALALLMIIVSTVNAFVSPDARAVYDQTMTIFLIVVPVVGAFLLWYSWMAKKKGVLR